MKYFNNLSDFVSATRDKSMSTVTARSLTEKCAGDLQQTTAANRADLDLPKEGLSAILTGYHVYAMLQLRPKLTTSNSNEDRRKNISLLGELVQGGRIIAHRYDGALLEAQGPVVHIFLPDNNDTPQDARRAALEIQTFIQERIQPRASEDFLKAVVAYSHGPTILVSAADSHGDESIVSLSPAANAPAKVLWKSWEDLPNHAILEVAPNGTYYQVRESDRQAVLAKSAGILFNASEVVQDVILLESRAAERALPAPNSPDSPTVEDPLKSFSVSFRADLENFTRNVSIAFNTGEEAVQQLALEFFELMTYARSFCSSKECIHLPWAGDCFNLLLSFEDREEYQEARNRRILTVALDFTRHMTKRFPQLGWAFSMAGGDLESAQGCNTLVSRITVGHTTILLATGLPVERSLQGLVRESPDEGRGVLWKGDRSQLDDDLKGIFDDSEGGENYRHFELRVVEKVQETFDFIPPPPPYQSASVPKAVAALAPVVKPHFG